MKLLDALLDLIYPPKCAFCHRLLRQKGSGVCSNCLDHLPYTGSAAVQNHFSNVELCVSPLYYEKTVRESLHRYKFEQLNGYAGIYVGFMVKCIDENKISCDIITWAPVSRQRLRERGYDQSRLLAQALAKHFVIPCAPLLVKTQNNPPQSLTKNAEERLRNVKGIYRCIDSELVKGKRILLVDDIVTSGATLSECAGVLKRSGASAVVAATVARSRS